MVALQLIFFLLTTSLILFQNCVNSQIYSGVDCSLFQFIGKLDPLLTLEYVVFFDENAVGAFRARLTLEGRAWIGFGQSNALGRMAPGRSVVGSEAGVLKYFHGGKSTDQVTPILRQTLKETSFMQNETHTVLEFTKLIEEDGEVPIEIGRMNTFIFAYGTSNRLGAHTAGQRGSVAIKIHPCSEPYWEKEGPTMPPSKLDDLSFTMVPTIPTVTTTHAPEVAATLPTSSSGRSSPPSNPPHDSERSVDLSSPPPTAPISTTTYVPTIPQALQTSLPTSKATTAPISSTTPDQRVQPTEIPTMQTTIHPTIIPTPKPSMLPTVSPIVPAVQADVEAPSRQTIPAPSSMPTIQSTNETTGKPTSAPTVSPTTRPTTQTVIAPTMAPTTTPTASPTTPPTTQPVIAPTMTPTTTTTASPTTQPTAQPVIAPTMTPTTIATASPTTRPTAQPVNTPTMAPTTTPTASPTTRPTVQPTSMATMTPTAAPTMAPTVAPTIQPTRQPSKAPTGMPTASPTARPTLKPTSKPTTSTTVAPTIQVTRQPTKAPTRVPTSVPTASPTARPTTKPTPKPSVTPTVRPTVRPTFRPTMKPTGQPTASPTNIPTINQSVGLTEKPTFLIQEISTPKPTSLSRSSVTCPFDEESVTIEQTRGIVPLVVSTAKTLCTLVQVSADGKSFKPVARSYNGQPWEASAGEFSALKCTCTDSACSVGLPPLPIGASYQLSTFFQPDVSDSDIISRFLEQATFGAALSDIRSFSGDSSMMAFANWVKTQQTSVPITSHRDFYRKHVNARFEIASGVGAVTHPCQAGTRYRRFTFSVKDHKKFVAIKTQGKKRFVSVDGFVRTVINGPITSGNVVFNDGSYQILYGDAGMDQIGGRIRMVHPSRSGTVDVSFGGRKGNPPVQFDSRTQANVVVDIPTGSAVEIDQLYYGSPAQEIILNRGLSDHSCASLGEPGVPINPVFAFYNGQYFLHDPRFETIDNTLESPAADGGGSVVRTTINALQPEFSTSCSNAPRTFLNEDFCYLSYEAATCTSATNFYSDLNFEITLRMTADIYNITGNGAEGTRYLYAIDGLRVEDDIDVAKPCAKNVKSRWMKVTCSGDAASVDPVVAKIFSELISASNDKNPLLRDVTNGIGDCPLSSRMDVGFEVVDKSGTCWLNVHPDHMNVYDFTIWTESHPGNRALFPRNPIKEPGEAGSAYLKFPLSHDMDRWQSNKSKFRFIGRLYDQGRFYGLPSQLRTFKTAEYFGFTAKTLDFVDSNGVMVCGSPYETANDRFLAGSQSRGAFDSFIDGTISTTPVIELYRQKRIVWTEVVLTADDQLRQRVAWALSQILVISQGAISGGDRTAEDFTSYYDIFVRHAFGSYRDVLKEVSYSSLMAEMLSFYESQSTNYIWTKSGRAQFADENYAREIMQLFSIGIVKLNQDGTVILDGNGEPVYTYTNEDIMEYARVWTGFTRQPDRGNIEETYGWNRVDPMNINVAQRDPYPKFGLDKTYIGDGYPLCVDLPNKHFLRRGAIYRLLGREVSPELSKPDPSQWNDSPSYQIMKLENGANSLFTKLCGSQNPASCSFTSKVVLDENLVCTGAECNVDTVRTVEVADGIFYEYVRPPCVYQAIFNNARTVTRRLGEGDFTCVDPRTESGNAACCMGRSRTWEDVYWGERSTLSTALQRCGNRNLCTRETRPSCDQKNPLVGPYCYNNIHFWTESACSLRLKVDDFGMVGLVHAPDVSNGYEAINPAVRNDTKTFFRVDWSGSFKPLLAICSTMPTCELTEDGACLCDVRLSEEQVFSDIPSRQDVLDMLHIGAFEPSERPAGSSGGVTWYNVDGDTALSINTVFEVVDDYGVRHLRKNMKSTATLAGTNMSFRNPVHFMSLTEPELRDAQYETDAALDHYFYHPNTAPFLALRFAQRFGISNPSPRYIESIARAFRTGTYSVGSNDFGSGMYGDLGAMIACVLLDREARSIVLDADPSYGSLKEPLIKYMGLMRSLEFRKTKDLLVDFTWSVGDKIGQMAHDIPNVFSFFLPEYSLSGPINAASLVSPEGQVLTSSRIVDSLNAYLSLIKYGLSQCWGGFRSYKSWDKEGCTEKRVGNFAAGNGSGGNLSYRPTNPTSAQAIVDELATLMTAGRLSKASRELIVQVISDEPNVSMKVIKAQQLITLTPEFHTTGMTRQSGKARQKPPPALVSTKPYRAVVYVLLAGGMDSFNLLVPHVCSKTNADGQTLLEQYNAERTILNLTDAERSLVIDADETVQPCSKFVVHPDLPIVEKLYKNGDLSFFANAGVINAATNKDNYYDVTKTRLFAHNTMQFENQRVDPFDTAPGSGALGRMCDLLTRKEYRAQPITIDDATVATLGVAQAVGHVDPVVVTSGTITTFAARPPESFDPRPFVDQLNNATKLQSSLFGESWSKLVEKALMENENLFSTLSSNNLRTSFPKDSFGLRLKTVSSLVADRESRKKDRDVFFVQFEGWDHHFQMKSNLASKFKALNAALSAFTSEMKAQGVWDDVTLVLTSEFGRTLTANSGEGSDHGWGGNYFAMGGGIKGGKIHGKYPDDITSASPLNVGRGRLIPTMSWESIMSSVIEWMGVNVNELDYCLPNGRRAGTRFLSRSEVFGN